MTALVQLAALLNSDTLPKADGSDVYGILTVALNIFGAIAVIVVIWAGIQLIISQGNSEKVAQARRSIIYAIAGLVIIFIAQAVVLYIKSELTKNT